MHRPGQWIAPSVLMVLLAGTVAAEPVAATIDARAGRSQPGPFDDDFPTVQDGARGVFFIGRAVESGKAGSWLAANYEPPG